MRQGVASFQAQRLTQAIEAWGITRVILANAINVSTAAISKWENGLQSPDEKHLSQISDFFKMPRHWFLKPLPTFELKHPYFFRSNAVTTKTARTIASVYLNYAAEIALTLQEWIEFPPLKLPIASEQNFLNIADFEIEALALECRSLWKIGDGPIPDVLLGMENAGIVCIRGELSQTHMDGVSTWYDQRPYVFLSADKANSIRNRFDAAHELGHIILHQYVSEDDYKKHYKEIERQANLFASMFLMPARAFSREISSFTLDGFLAMKPRWKVSIAAMIMRAYQMNLLTEDHKTRLYKGLSGRKWTLKEPYDDLPFEQPKLLHRSIKMLVEHEVIAKDDLLYKLALPARTVDEICNLDSYFNDTDTFGNGNLINISFSNKKPKTIVTHNEVSNVVPFNSIRK